MLCYGTRRSSQLGVSVVRRTVERGGGAPSSPGGDV
jgi:hypothetical protein